jgi:hypothetical protein
MASISSSQRDTLIKAVDALADISDFSDTASVDVKMDVVAAALVATPLIKRTAAKTLKGEGLYDVLQYLVRSDLIDDQVLDACDEITSLIEYKDYEGMTDEELSEELEVLVESFRQLLHSAILAMCK